MRGEKMGCCPYTPLVWGSPPHARGKVFLQVSIASIHRITPACAGKRFFACQFFNRFRDHPRMRGEMKSNHIGSRLK